MKKLIFLLCGFFIWQSALSQHVLSPQSDRNVNGFLSQLGSDGADTTYTIIKGRTFTSITDTTIILNTVNHKTFYVALTTLDSATILIDYAVSNDAVNFSAFTLKDSLSNATSGNGFKSVDLTSTILGYPYVRFRFRSSALAFVLGTTTPTYSATYLWKKE